MNRIKEDNPEVSIVALHEAGHAVVGVYLRVPFSRVTIKPKNNSGGHVTPIIRQMPSNYDDFEQTVLDRAYKRLPADAIVGNEDEIVQRSMDRTFANRRRGLMNTAIMLSQRVR